jgi:hypothetical protein
MKLKCVAHDRRVVVFEHPRAPHNSVYEDVIVARHRSDGSACGTEKVSIGHEKIIDVSDVYCNGEYMDYVKRHDPSKKVSKKKKFSPPEKLLMEIFTGSESG